MKLRDIKGLMPDDKYIQTYTSSCPSVWGLREEIGDKELEIDVERVTNIVFGVFLEGNWTRESIAQAIAKVCPIRVKEQPNER